MAELYIIGEIIDAIDFIEPSLFIKWGIQHGTSWKLIEGSNKGQTVINSGRLENSSSFSHPIDVHLGCRGLQGWPKIHIEVYAINALKQYWPVGFGFAHIPTTPGTHKLQILTWRQTPGTFYDALRYKFHSGGLTIAKNDLIFSGIERYKLYTNSAGKINVNLMTIFKNFSNFGVEIS